MRLFYVIVGEGFMDLQPPSGFWPQPCNRNEWEKHVHHHAKEKLSPVGDREAGVPYVIELNRGETYHLVNRDDEPSDLTGTIITSNQPITVFGGHGCANIPPGGPKLPISQPDNPLPDSSCGGIAQQLPPTESWGTNFLTMPLANPVARPRLRHDTFRLLAATDGTGISINGNPVAVLNRGQYLETSLGQCRRSKADW